jgi:hypothetical protein
MARQPAFGLHRSIAAGMHCKPNSHFQTPTLVFYREPVIAFANGVRACARRPVAQRRVNGFLHTTTSNPLSRKKLKAQFNSLDPVRLLHDIRTAQHTLSELAVYGARAELAPVGELDVAVFLASLSWARNDGEARPTHRKQPKAKHWWRSRVDPFADAWPLIEGWLIAEACAGQRIDGSVGRDVSRSVCKSGTTTDAAAPGQGVASRARKGTDSGRPAKVC